MSTKQDLQNEEIRVELLAAGIDVDITIAACRRMTSSHDGIDKGEVFGKDHNSSTVEEKFLRKQMRSLVGMFLASSVALLSVTYLLSFGFVSAEPWVFVARAAIVLLFLIIVFSIFALLHGLWAAYLVERDRRIQAEGREAQSEEMFSVVRGLLQELC